MIKNEETYCVVWHKLVRELGACEAVIYGTIASLLRKTDGIGEVSNQTLMDMCGLNNKMSLKRYMDKLIAAGYIEKRAGDGRGNISIYYVTEKGNNLLPFNEKKGNKNDTERVTKMNEKGNNLLPINKGINKELNKESDGVMREAHTTPLSTTTTNFENMEDFNLFWDLYPGDPEWSWRKEECERVWYAMQTSWRDNLVQMLQNGIRWRKRENDDPYWYLKNYNGQVVHAELPFVTQGTAKFIRWIDDAKRNGREVVMVRYENILRHCLKTDLQTMIAAGAEYVGEFKP